MFEWIDLFSSLGKEDLNTLSLFCQEREIKEWEILFQEWDDSSSMYIVKSWNLEVYSWEKILWVVNAWEFVWEMSLFNSNKVRSASVKALTDTSLIVLISFSIENLSKKHPEIMEKIKEVISRRNEMNNTKY